MALNLPLTRTTVSVLICATWLSACGGGGGGGTGADALAGGPGHSDQTGSEVGSAAQTGSTDSIGAGGADHSGIVTESVASTGGNSVSGTGVTPGPVVTDGSGSIAAGGSNSGSGSGSSTSGNTGSDGQPATGPVEGEKTGGQTAETVAGPAGAAAGTYGRLTFREEWSTAALDRDKWLTRMFHWGNAPELDNWKIEGGVLKMWTPRMANGQFLFENRAMNTDGKFSQRYGWFEMEAKLPRGRGLWPSFWLYAHNDHTRPEIDIMEAYGGGDQWWATADGRPIDYGATIWVSPEDGSSGDMISHQRPSWNPNLNLGDLTAGFHKYGALWEPDGITFFFDGQPVGPKVRTTRLNQQMYLILGLGTGTPGSFNAPTSETPTTSANAYEINYVRVWALPQGTTTGGSHADPSR